MTGVQTCALPISVEEAEKEINLWFNKDEIINYRLVQEQILYDVNLDGILE